MQVRSAHVLIVDDDALNRALLINNLERQGHETPRSTMVLPPSRRSRKTSPTSFCLTSRCPA